MFGFFGPTIRPVPLDPSIGKFELLKTRLTENVDTGIKFNNIDIPFEEMPESNNEMAA